HGLDGAAGTALSRDTNDAISEMVERHPTRFRGLAFLPLQEPRSAVAELERVMASRAFVGAMVGTHVEGMDWDDPRLEPVLEAAESLGAMVFIHPAAV
ncbi:MAG: amidohydrolase family protein, partial [Actinobacteria bacterium]|nr:amidohydrolase family protein [Actinomycetota bacterium]